MTDQFGFDVCAYQSVKNRVSSKSTARMSHLLLPHLNLSFVTATQNSSTSLAHSAVPSPYTDSQQSGNPPIPSNRLPRVALSGRRLCMFLNSHFQNGKAIELPMALYLVESDDFLSLPIQSTQCSRFVYSSGNPCSRSHSKGVSLRRRLSQRTNSRSLPSLIP